MDEWNHGNCGHKGLCKYSKITTIASNTKVQENL